MQEKSRSGVPGRARCIGESDQRKWREAPVPRIESDSALRGAAIDNRLPGFPHTRVAPAGADPPCGTTGRRRDRARASRFYPVHRSCVLLPGDCAVLAGSHRRGSLPRGDESGGGILHRRRRGRRQPLFLGFANDYSIDGQKHGTSVYVRGSSARLKTGRSMECVFVRKEVSAVTP